MAAARLLPRNEVEISKITEFAAAALRDRRRKVRHAALEALATLAQLSSNVEVLDTVNRICEAYQDRQYLLRVVRTRWVIGKYFWYLDLFNDTTKNNSYNIVFKINGIVLNKYGPQLQNPKAYKGSILVLFWLIIFSLLFYRLSRRQLPIVEMDGKVRYSTPRDQTEVEWLAGVTIPASPPSSTTSTPPVNYWRHNSRHEEKAVSLPLQSSEVSRCQKNVFFYEK